MQQKNDGFWRKIGLPFACVSTARQLGAFAIHGYQTRPRLRGHPPLIFRYSGPQNDMPKIEFRRAIIPEEIEALCEFDRKVFHDFPSDVFSPEEWKKYESYWMIVDEAIVGCAALQTDQRDELWIASTAISPESQGQQFGNKMKQWEIDYAKSHGFERIATQMRLSNQRSIELNKKFGFTTVRIAPNGYSNPDEAALVMQLRLPLPSCPKCGKTLRTHRAKQCACGADWHVPHT